MTASNTCNAPASVWALSYTMQEHQAYICSILGIYNTLPKARKAAIRCVSDMLLKGYTITSQTDNLQWALHHVELNRNMNLYIEPHNIL